MKTSVFIAAIFICLSASSCSKKDATVQQQNNFPGCFYGAGWSDASIKKNIVGSWKLTKEVAGMAGEVVPENILLIFSADGKIRVIKDGKLVQTDNFTIEQQGNVFRINSNIEYTFGDLIVCNNEFECSMGYVDGYDYYFQRYQ